MREGLVRTLGHGTRWAVSSVLAITTSGCFLSGDYRVWGEGKVVSLTSPTGNDAATPSATQSTGVMTSPSVTAAPTEVSSGSALLPSISASASSPEAASDAGAEVSPEASTSPPECASDEITGPDGRCYWISSTNVAWSATYSLCTSRGEGWYTLSVRSEDEHLFITGELTADTWIGAGDSTEPDTWVWLEDDSVFWTGKQNGSAPSGAFAAWAVGEPSARIGESCAYYRKGPTWNWVDIDCNRLFIAACKGPAAPTSSLN